MLKPFVFFLGFLSRTTLEGSMRPRLGLLIGILAALLAAPAGAQERPRYGGELLFAVPSEPPSYDAHREETFGVMHPMAPHYNTLLRVDPNDRTGTKPVGDLAESWTAAKDGRTYTFKLRRGLKFPSASFLASVASPWNWIYKADLLAKDMRWYETNVMGTGPFLFVEHQKGSHWVGKRNPNYWDKGKPYLDGYRAIFIKDSAAQVSAIRGERAHIQFRGFSPAERDSLVAALGARIAVQESPWDCVLLATMNHEKKPFDDKRVRRALTLALDRYQGSQALSKIAIVKEVAGVQVPGTPFATPPVELEKLAGYWRDINKSRAEARRLLKQAGVPEGFVFTFKNREVPMPYEPLGVWLIDQWRQVGLNVTQEVAESAKWFADLRGGDFEVAMDAQCGYMVEPDLDLYKFQSGPTSADPRGISDANYTRYKDSVLDELYIKQGRAIDLEERKKYVREFEKRLLDEEVHTMYTLQWHRIIPHNSRVKGWTVTPSHYLNNQLDTVWLAE